MANKILGAAEGFLPKALTLENPTAAITTEGPSVLISIIRMIVKFFISNVLLLFWRSPKLLKLH
jgi:hypothetical protein